MSETTKTCKFCGREFVGKTDRLYCSSKCRNGANNRARSERTSDRISAPVACEWCGSEFVRSRMGMRFCSYKCANNWKHHRCTLAEYTAKKEDERRRRQEKLVRTKNRKSTIRAAAAVNGVTVEQMIVVATAQDGDPSKLYAASREWTAGMHRYAKRRYEIMHGLGGRVAGAWN